MQNTYLVRIQYISKTIEFHVSITRTVTLMALSLTDFPLFLAVLGAPAKFLRPCSCFTAAELLPFQRPELKPDDVATAAKVDAAVAFSFQSVSSLLPKDAAVAYSRGEFPLTCLGPIFCKRNLRNSLLHLPALPFLTKSAE